ncbi:MAG: hypothetical protein Q8R98_09665, partial [Rubrivivax sp.]|nr:hypothetical protein [Rubrivivax sp.]
DQPAHVGGHWVKFGTDRARIAQELHRVNAEAFAAAYGERVKPEAFRPELLPCAASLKVGQVYELLTSYLYNSEDAPGFAESDACGHCSQLLAALCKSLPGRAGARWQVETPAEVAQLAGIAA